MEDFEIVPIDHIYPKFETFLKREGNKRIVLSGVFGTGKTFFLKQYFSKENEEYIALHLYPTNYSIASNRDIIELIKYDMLYELIGQENIKLDKLDVSFFEALYFLKDDLANLVSGFASRISSIGKFVSVVSPKFKLLFFALDKAFSGIKVVQQKKAQLSKDDSASIKKFIKLMKNEQGGIYENDFYTQLINSLIAQLKNDSGSSRKVALIIDDLDRIDPEHIFRVLNVFAVHFDIKHENANKFDVDKIILCCDFDNIRKIFSNKYGQNVDFNGYIGKFFDSEVFQFDNSEMISKIIEKVIPSIQTDGRQIRPRFMDKTSKQFGFSKSVLSSMVHSGVLSLASLKRLYKSSMYDLFSFKSNLPYGTVEPLNCMIVPFLVFITKLFHGHEYAYSAIERTNFEPKDFHSLKHILADLIFIVDYKNHVFSEFQTPKPFEANGLIYYYKMTSHLSIERVERKNGDAVIPITEHVNIHFKHLLLEAIRIFFGNSVKGYA